MYNVHYADISSAKEYSTKVKYSNDSISTMDITHRYGVTEAFLEGMAQKAWQPSLGLDAQGHPCWLAIDSVTP